MRMRVSSLPEKRERDDGNDDIITLVAGDGEQVEVKRSIALLFGTIANLLQEFEDQQEILLPPNIRGTILQHICTTLGRQQCHSFMLLHGKKEVECIEILLAANYLDLQMRLQSRRVHYEVPVLEALCDKVLEFNLGRWGATRITPMGPADVLPMDNDPGTTTFALDQVATLDHIPRALLNKYIFHRLAWEIQCAARLDSVSMAYAVQRYMEQKARTSFPKLAAMATADVLIHCFIDAKQEPRYDTMQKCAAKRLYALTDNELASIQRDERKNYPTREVAEAAFIKYNTWEALREARVKSIARDEAAKERLEQARIAKRDRVDNNRRHLVALLLREKGYVENALTVDYKGANPEWRELYNRWLAKSQNDIHTDHPIYKDIVDGIANRIRTHAHKREFNQIDELVTPTKFAEIVASNLVGK